MPENDQMSLLVNEVLRRMPQPVAAPAPIAPMANGFPPMMPAAAMQPAGWGMQPVATQALQPVGVSLPLTIQLPDGRDCPIRVHFGPEHATSYQALVQLVASAAQIFGPALKAYQPRAFGPPGSYGGYRPFRGGRRY